MYPVRAFRTLRRPDATAVISLTSGVKVKEGSIVNPIVFVFFLSLGTGILLTVTSGLAFT